jgi:hypothetical protein
MKALILITALLVATGRADDEDMADFVGGVLGESGIVTGRNTAVTASGKFVSFNGRGYATSDGYYGMNKNQVWGKKGLVVKSGNFFYGSSSSWKNGNSYRTDGKNNWVVRKKTIDD